MLRSAHVVYEVCHHQRLRRMVDKHGLLQPETVNAQFIEDSVKSWFRCRINDAIYAQVAALFNQGWRRVQLRGREGDCPLADPGLMIPTWRIEVRHRSERLDGGAALGGQGQR